MKRCLVCLLLLGALGCTTVHAATKTTLYGAYQDAYKNDPTYQQARAAFEANQVAMTEAAAVFYPQLAATGTLASNYQEQNINDISVQVSQTVFNWSYFMQIGRARAVVNQSVAALSAAEQDLMRRITQGYLNVVQSKAMLEVAEEQYASMGKQLYAVHERYKLGHATITDLDRVKANYDLYRSQELTARITLNTSKEQLAAMTGLVYHYYPSIHFNFRLIKPTPARLAPWVDKAKTQNWALKAAELNVLTAEKSVSVQKAGYYPSMQVTGNYFPEKHRYYDKHFIYGLNLSYDFFQGGLTYAQVHRAVADLNTAKANRDAAFLQAITVAQSSYVSMIEGVNQLASQKRAVLSNRNALRHTEEGYIAGTQTILDVLEQRNNLFNAERTYVQGRISYLNSLVQLELAAGTLKPKTLQSLQIWLY